MLPSFSFDLKSYNLKKKKDVGLKSTTFINGSYFSTPWSVFKFAWLASFG